MTPAPTRLSPQLWMTDQAAQAVMAALSRGGKPSRFVGGCVRNALLKREVADIDIATALQPQAVMELAASAGLHAVGTGIEHGTVTIIAQHKPFEVTTLREDVETDGRRAVIAYTDDWLADARRRDFTMNAIYADADGTLYDPTGGICDLEAGRVRFIGSPEQRIAEDYLRILRFFRIHAFYGRGPFDREGLAACAARIEGIARLSGERIQKEMLRLLSVDAPGETLRVMAASGVLGAVLPGALQIERCARVALIEEDHFFAPDPVLRLGALLSEAEDARSVAVRWRLSNADRARLIAMHEAELKIVSYLSIREVRRLLYRHGVRLFKDVTMLRWAEDPRPVLAQQWRALLALADSWVRPEFPLTGHEIMAAGVPGGPMVGKVSAEVEDWWVDSDFTDDKFSIIERLKAVAQALVTR